MNEHKDEIDKILEELPEPEASARTVDEPPAALAPPPEPAPRRRSWRLWLSLVLLGAATFGGWQLSQRFGASGVDLAPIEARLATQDSVIADLRAETLALKNRLEQAENRPSGAAQADLDALRAEVDALKAAPANDAATSALTARLDRLESAIANAAASSDPASASALALLRSDIDSLQSDLATRLTDLNQRVAALESRPETAPVADGGDGTLRTALAEIAAALETGDSFATQMLVVNEAQPNADGLEDLAAHAGGVATLTALQDSFPDAARAALDAAREAETVSGDGSSRLGAFLKDQLGMRSLTPQDGADADAILSRAQAAVDLGDLAAALGELAALPEPAIPAMADWRAKATARLAASEALTRLQTALQGN